MVKIYHPKIVAWVVECPLDPRHTHKLKVLNGTFSCRGTVFLSGKIRDEATVLIPGPKGPILPDGTA